MLKVRMLKARMLIVSMLIGRMLMAAVEEVIRKRRSWVEHQVSLDPPTHPAISTSSSS